MAEKYTPGGRAHRMLERLAKGPATQTELAEIVQGPSQSWASAKHKAWRLLIHLEADGLVIREPVPTITASGRAWLAQHGPSDAVIPSAATVRVFGYPRHAVEAEA